MATGLPFMSYRDGFMNPPKKVAVTESGQAYVTGSVKNEALLVASN